MNNGDNGEGITKNGGPVNFIVGAGAADEWLIHDNKEEAEREVEWK